MLGVIIIFLTPCTYHLVIPIKQTNKINDNLKENVCTCILNTIIPYSYKVLLVQNFRKSCEINSKLNFHNCTQHQCIYAHAYKYFMNQIFMITSSITKLLYHENLKKYDMSQANELTRCVRKADRVFLKGQ